MTTRSLRLIVPAVVLATVAMFAPVPMFAQAVCTQPVTLRAATCPSGSTTCITKGQTLLFSDLDNDMIDVINICNYFTANVNPHLFYGGPTSGPAVAPTFRLIQALDINPGSGNQVMVVDGGIGAWDSFGGDLNCTVSAGTVSCVVSQVRGTSVSPTPPTTGQFFKYDGIFWKGYLITTADLPTLPNPSASTLGGVESLAAVGSKWINTISTSGVPSATQPNYTDLAGVLPNPSATTLGGIESIAAAAHNFLTSISTSGVPAKAQPACGDLSDASAACNSLTNLTLVTPTLNGIVKATGTAPTVSCTGVGTGGTSTIASGGTNAKFEIVMTAGTSASTFGLCTVTFASPAYVTNFPVCVLTYVGPNWSNTQPLFVQSQSLTAPVFEWIGSALGSTSIYKIDAICFQ
jgi:hypothetical protein